MITLEEVKKKGFKRQRFYIKKWNWKKFRWDKIETDTHRIVMKKGAIEKYVFEYKDYVLHYKENGEIEYS